MLKASVAIFFKNRTNSDDRTNESTPSSVTPSWSGPPNRNLQCTTGEPGKRCWHTASSDTGLYSSSDLCHSWIHHSQSHLPVLSPHSGKCIANCQFLRLWCSQLQQRRGEWQARGRCLDCAARINSLIPSTPLSRGVTCDLCSAGV